MLHRGCLCLWFESDLRTRNSMNGSVLLNNALQVGIVGLPNVGKSTLYNTLTKCSIPAENFPFCTIDPNEVMQSNQVVSNN